MGFDSECIVNMQSLAGEYFCPVCRLLVYPNEALQSQCTHLYCKPCLTYIVGTTHACPYDGYLVTEADSKPLIETNKSLAETIGKTAVHCLYHRSGCQWQGPLSECSSHCSGCAFGNSPVVCNRCAIQIVHRQVQEHAQICTGVQSQIQQAEGVQDVAAPATSSNPQQTQTANQSGASSSQAQTSQAVAAPSSSQAIASSLAMAVAPAPVPTPEQLYQQQYQQYYQQYPGYDPYQQAYQHYYQQQVVQQYQQHPPHVPVQHQSQVYSQPQAQVHLQPQAQVQPQTHSLPQTQLPHTQPQPIQHVQPPVAAQTSVNPQHQLHTAVQHPTQVQSHAYPPPHGHPHPQPQPQPQPHPQPQPQPQPQPYAGFQGHSQPLPIQPHSLPPMQMPQYQQPQSQFQHPQILPQPQHQTVPHSQPQAHLQAQPQAPLPHPHPQIQPPLLPNQPPAINAQPQTQYLQAHAVTGNQSYPQPQAHQQMQMGAQAPPHMHVQMPGQFPQQPPLMRPPQSHAPVPNQQRPSLLPPQGPFPNVPSVQHPIHPHGQQPSHPGQRPVVQPMPQQHVQHQQAFPVQASAPVQNQLHQHGNLVPQQQFMQAQMGPQGPPHSMQQNSVAYMSSQQNVAPSHGLPPHQSQNYAARPVMPNGTQAQLFSQTSGFSGAAQVRPMQFSGNKTTTNQNYGPRANNQMHVVSEQHVQSGLTSKPTGAERQGDHMPGKSLADQNKGSPFHRTAQNEPNGSSLGALSVEGKYLKSETDVQKPINGDEDLKFHVEVHVKDSGSDLHASGNGLSEPANKHMVKTEGDKSMLESSPGINSVENVAAENKDASDGTQHGEHSTGGDTSLLTPEASKDQTAKLKKDAVDAGMLELGGPSGADRLRHGSQERNLSQSHGLVPEKGFMPPPHHFPPIDQGRHQHMALHHGPSSNQQAALFPGPPYRAEVPGQPPNFVRPQGPGHLPPPGGIPGPSSAAFGQVPSHFGPSERPFEPHYNQSHVPPPPGSYNSPGGIMGRAQPHGTEGQISQQPPINTIGSENFSKQRLRYLDGGQPDSQLIGYSDRAPFGQSHGIESSAVRMKEGPVIDSSATVGFRGERFMRPTEEGLSRFPSEPAWRNDRGEFAEDLKQFPRHPHFDTEPPSKFGNHHSSSRFNDRDPLVKAPHGGNYDAGLQLDPGAGGPRFLPPYRPGVPNDARPVGPDGNMGRADPTHPDFLGPVPGFGRHHMDRPTPRSPGREYPGFPPRDFGGLSGFPRNHSGLDDIDGPRPFGGGSRNFNFPPDPAGNSFHENRFPLLPGHLRRGEFDGPDILPSHLRRSEFLGPRTLPGHSRFGEPAGFGGFTGHSRMGELDGPGNFPRHQPFGEPFGSGHPRLGEPGFRSSYSATGGMDPFEHSRKRKSSSMGWCRICKVDCETVEGLDLHSQTREHQKMAMDMVLTIKQQSKKRQKASHDKSPAEEPSKLRGSGNEARGNKA